MSASKAVMAFIPNIEPISFLIIMFTLFFGRRAFFSVGIFVLVEFLIYPMGDWAIMYLYIWPLLGLVALLLCRLDNVWLWSIISGMFGLIFGALCSITYFGIGAASGGIAFGLRTALAKWISGIPFDLIHGVGNFLIMLVLYKPIRAVLTRIKKLLY